MEIRDPKTRKIFSFVFFVFGALIFITWLIGILFVGTSLPPYSTSSEGRYVAFCMTLWMFFWSVPFIFSLLLISYLIHPSKFEKFSMIKKFLFVAAAVFVFGMCLFICALGLINSPLPENDALSYFLAAILDSVFASSAFLAMGVCLCMQSKKMKKNTLLPYT